MASGINFYADIAQLVEYDLAKVEVAGSSPVVRSREIFDGQETYAGYERYGSPSSHETVLFLNKISSCHCFRHRYGGTHKPKRTFLDSRYESRTARFRFVFL